MPCELEYSEEFIHKVKEQSKQKINKIKETLAQLKDLAKPTDRGGAYQK